MECKARVAILLVNWNGSADTVACLDSLMTLRDDDICIVVADNASSDDSLARIKAWSSRHPHLFASDLLEISHPQETSEPLSAFINIVHTGGNLGFAAANNIGIRMALLSPDITHVWLLNNDTEVLPNTLQALRQRFVEEPAIGLCGSTLVFHHDKSTIQTVGTHFYLSSGYGESIGFGLKLSDLPTRDAVEADMVYVPGASMLLSRAFLETVGLMEERYFLYGEELDWALRNNGRFKLGWAPDSIVYHKEGATIGTSTRGRQSPVAVYYQNRSTLQVAKAFCPSSVPKVTARILLRAARFLWRGDWENAIAAVRAILEQSLTGPRSPHS